MIDRYEPFGRAMSLRQMMDRMLEDAFVMPRAGEGMGSAPALDVYEEGDDLVVEAQLPGVKPDDIDISIEQGVLTISGQTKAEQERKERNYHIREQRTGRFTRGIRLPATYNAEACKANYEDGVLRLVFPKAEEAKPRRIQIGAGSQPSMLGQTGGAQQPRATTGGMSMRPEDRA
jgi:HSP20 family protein